MLPHNIIPLESYIAFPVDARYFSRQIKALRRRDSNQRLRCGSIRFNHPAPLGPWLILFIRIFVMTLLDNVLIKIVYKITETTLKTSVLILHQAII